MREDFGEAQEEVQNGGKVTYCTIMIIPVRCFTCGKVIGNKYDTYLELIDQQQQRVEEARQRGDLDREEMYAAHDELTEDGKRRKLTHPHSPLLNYSDVLNELGLTRYCCRRMLLTHVDLMTRLLNYNSTNSPPRTFVKPSLPLV